jgi:hypothetical protein
MPLYDVNEDVDYGQYIDPDTLIKDVKSYARVLKRQSPTSLARKKSLDDMKEVLKDYEIKKSLMPNVVVEDSGPVDIIRDAKWVYENIGRLFYKDDIGLEFLDEDFLKTSPSNGAISMAHYCWNHRKEFFEKFIFTKVVKEEDKKQEKTEAELASELDPTVEGLEKYIEKLEPNDSH